MRVAQFADERSNAIRLRLEKNELKLSSSTVEAGESEDVLQVRFNGDPTANRAQRACESTIFCSGTLAYVDASTTEICTMIKSTLVLKQIHLAEKSGVKSLAPIVLF
jgi:hypothetical protein